MYDANDYFQVILLSILDISALIINVFYIYIIRRKTPKTLYSYSLFLLNIAIVDLLSALCNFMCSGSIQNFKGRMIILFLGPCTLISKRVCHFIFTCHAEFLGQSILLLVASFSYRLWVLRRASLKWKNTFQQQQQSSAIWLYSRLAIALFGVLNGIVLFRAGSYKVPGFHSDHPLSAFDLTGGITDNLLSKGSVFFILAAYVIGFNSILIIRARLFAGIRNRSAKDRHKHQQIYRSLTVQMLLPLASNIGTSFWLLDVVGIVHSRALHQSIFILSSLFALASPMINMYYIPPYRRYVKSLLSANSQISPLKMSTDALHSGPRF